jgi:hypothetical protein
MTKNYEQWLKEAVSEYGIEWVLEAVYNRRDTESVLAELGATILRAERVLTGMGIEYPSGGDLLFPVATAAIKMLERQAEESGAPGSGNPAQWR